jgi:chemotaxis signal transduction protein
MTSARAWLLDWPPQPLALALCEVIEIVESPEIHRVPVGPDWCRALLFWRSQMLPLAIRKDELTDALKIVVVAYQPAPRTALKYAAFAVQGTPRQIEVDASMDCAIEPGSTLDASRLRACFRFEQRSVVVPELSLLFEALAA